MPNNICRTCGSPGYLYARHGFYQCRALNPEKPYCAEAWPVGLRELLDESRQALRDEVLPVAIAMEFMMGET